VQSVVVTNPMNEVVQSVMEQHGEIWVRSLPMLPTMGGVGSWPTCLLRTATKQAVIVGSTKMKPATMSGLKQICLFAGHKEGILVPGGGKMDGSRQVDIRLDRGEGGRSSRVHAGMKSDDKWYKLKLREERNEEMGKKLVEGIV